MKNLIQIILIILLAGCELYEQDQYREMIAVEAYAIANRSLPAVYVSTTMPAVNEYSFEDAAIDNAIVQISLMSENEDEEDTFSYVATAPGTYLPQTSHTIIPGRTYRLDIQFNNRSEVLQAYTTIPNDFTIQNEVRDTVVYQSDEQLELVVSAIDREDSQNVFVINTIAQAADFDNLTPFYRSLIDEDDDSELEDFINNSSGLINEGNFEINEDGTITLSFPWIGVAFFEENLVVTNNVDKNLSDFIRSQEIQLGGSTLPPGEIPNARYNVEGGIGVFGSISSDTVATYFSRPF